MYKKNSPHGECLYSSSFPTAGWNVGGTIKVMTSWNENYYLLWPSYRGSSPGVSYFIILMSFHGLKIQGYQ